MFSLIITVISIALALVLLLAVIYYGSEAFGKHADKVVAETLVNQSVQIASAQQVARSQGLPTDTGGTVTLPANILRSMPVPPKAAYVTDTPTAEDWTYYAPGIAGHFGLQTKLSKRACMAVNKQQDFIGIPAAWDGTSAVQCFGWGAGGYTYLYQPSGQSKEQRDAVLDKSIKDIKTLVPEATAGYPRLCPDDTTINEGVCPGGTGSGGTPATPPTAPPAGGKKPGFWVIVGAVANSQPSLFSKGFSETCPAGAIDPTTAAASPPASASGEAFNVDGVVEMEWDGPSGNYGLALKNPLKRTWCIPAWSTDTMRYGYMVDTVDYGSVTNSVFVSNPTDAKIKGNVWPSSSNATVSLTAKEVQWTLMASFFSLDVNNTITGSKENFTLDGRKIAIGKTATASESYFLASPVKTSKATYQYLSGTITFSAPPPPPSEKPYWCDEALNISTPGVGGAIVDLKGTEYYTAMLKADGSVWVAGESNYGALGTCNYDAQSSWTRVATNVAAIDLDPTQAHLYLTKKDGSLWLSGDAQGSEYGAGRGWGFQNAGFVQLEGANVVRGGGGLQYSAQMRGDGTIWFVGYNGYNEANRLGSYKSTFDSFVQVDSGAISMYAGDGNIFYIKGDHSLWASGASDDGHLGYVDNDGYMITDAPVKIANNVAKVMGNVSHTVYVTTDGRAFAAGADTWQVGMFGQGESTFDFPVFTQLLPQGGRIVDAVVTNEMIKLLGEDGRLWAAGADAAGNFGFGPQYDTFVFQVIATNVAKFTAGGLILDKSGALWGAGDNSRGQYGDGTTDTSTAFKRIPY